MEKININGNRYYKHEDKLYPSVTSILKYYPKGESFYKWLSNTSIEEAERIRDSAGEQGSNVHKAIEEYIKTGDTYVELSIEESKLFNVFVIWYQSLKNVEVIAQELSVYNDEYQYAGTIDLVLKIGEELRIIDIKTSNHIHAIHKLQLSAYKHCGFELAKMGILHLKSNKFIEVEDCFDVFLACKKIFDFEVNK